MDHPMAFIGMLLSAAMLVVFGWLICSVSRDEECKSGIPTVIHGKVYRCVEGAK